MKTLKIYGASDDLVEMDGIAGADEFNCYKDESLLATFVLKADNERLRIHAIYDGSWCFALGQVEEDDPMPPWPVRRTWSGYSEHVEIDVPDHARVDRES